MGSSLVKKKRGKQKSINDLSLTSLPIKPNSKEFESKEEQQLMRDFGRFPVTIGGIEFKSVEERAIRRNLEDIRAAIRENVRSVLEITKGKKLEACVAAVLDGLYNTRRRGEVWDAVREKCGKYKTQGVIHTRPTTSRIPTTAVFENKCAITTIGTGIQVWEETKEGDMILVSTVTCRTITTIKPAFLSKAGFSRSVSYHVSTKQFAEEEKEEENNCKGKRFFL